MTSVQRAAVVACALALPLLTLLSVMHSGDGSAVSADTLNP
jgi:hypothetical protein